MNMTYDLHLFRPPQLKMKQVDGSLKSITKAYADDSLGTAISQYLNGTNQDLAVFGPSPTTAQIYYNSNPPYTEVIQATVTTPVYITGVEIGLPHGLSAPLRSVQYTIVATALQGPPAVAFL